MGKGIRVVKVIEEPLSRRNGVALRRHGCDCCGRAGNRTRLGDRAVIQTEGREYVLKAIEEVILERQRLRFEEVEVARQFFDFCRNFLD